MRKDGMDRRKFMKAAAVGAAGGMVTLKVRSALARMGGGGGGMGGGGMGGGGGSGVIDPPVGVLFADPKPMQLKWSSEPVNGVLRDVCTANIEAGIFGIDVNGTTANLMTYKDLASGQCVFPAPTITLPKGAVLRINLKNGFPSDSLLETNLLGHQRGITNLHTHGWHVSPKSFPDAVPPYHSDYVMYGLRPGESTLHQYDTSLEKAGGFHFYHPHYHGLAAEQYWGGLVGALITKDENSYLSGLEAAGLSHVIVLKDISLVGSDPAPHDTMMDYMHGKEGSIVMVNGQVNPYLPIRPGQVQRWRILNASNGRFYKLNLSGHKMYLIGTDGSLLNRPYPLDQILLSPGERVDVLVKAGATIGDYKLLSMPYSRMGMMTSAQITLLTMRVKGTWTSASLPAAIDPKAARSTIDTSTLKQETIALSMGQGQGYINGIPYRDMDNAFSIHSDDPRPMPDGMGPSWEVWNVVNNTGMDHPFHQHVERVQVLSISGADSSYPPYASIPAWKDTVLIPRMGSARLLVPVTDFDGTTMFHCHILEHEDMGMMGVWHRGMSMPMP